MDSLNLKLLKKLAKTCREAGISSYEGHGFKFTLADMPSQEESAAKASNKAVSVSEDSRDNNIDSDSLTDEQLLNWSIFDPSVPAGSEGNT